MSLVAFLFVLAALFVLMAFGQPLAERLRISFTVLLALLGIAIGAGAAFLIATPFTDAFNEPAEAILHLPIHSEAFLYVFLPTLLFHVALTIDLRRMLEDWVPISVMAIVAVVVATFAIGFALEPFTTQPLVVCLLVGAIVATTDPSAVVGIFRDIGAPARLSRLAEGESLMNDAAAIALFTLFIRLILPWAPEVTVASQIQNFLVLLVAGALAGYAAGALTVLAMDRLRGAPMAVLSLSVALPYLTYILAEHALHVSGVIAVVAAGMTVNLLGPSRVPPATWRHLTDTWELLAHWAGSLIFILAAIFVPRMLDNITLADVRLLAVLIVAATLARALVLFGLLPALTAAGLSPGVNRATKLVMLWGGLRGAVTLALALAVTEHPLIPAEAKRHVAVLATGFALFTLLVQGTTLRWLMNRLGLDRLGPLESALQDQVMAVALQRVREEMGETVARHQLTEATAREEEAALAGRIDLAVARAEEAEAILDRDRLTLGLVTLASREKEMILESVHDRQVSHALVERLMMDADRLIEATRQGGRAAYRTTARLSLATGRAHRRALWLARRLGLSQPLERLTADRFERMLTTRMFLRDLHGFIDSRILRIHGRRVAELLHEILARREEDLDRDMAGLRLQYPGFAEAVERQMIRRAALRFEEREYETAAADGLIGAELADKLMRGLEARRRAGEARPRLDMQLQKEAFVAQIPLFAALQPEDRRRLARVLVSLHAAPGEVVLRRGDPAEAVYFIASGAVEVEHEDGRVARHGRGEMFGEMALVAGRAARHSEVRAIAHSAFLMLDEPAFRALVQRAPGLRRELWRAAIRHGADEATLARILGRRPPEAAGG